MTQVGRLHNNNNPFSFNPPHHHHNNKFDHGNSKSLSQIFHLQLPELVTSTQHSRSPASSACPSDDSGIERTLNLSPSSPFPEDTDSDDAQSFAGFEVRRSNSHLQMRQHPLKVGTSYHQFGCDSKYVDVARLSPPGTCAAVVEDTCCPLASPTALNKPKVVTNGNRFQILSYEQVTRLHHVLSKTIPIHSRHPGFPTIRVKLNDLFGAVRGNLKAAGIPVRNMRLNGGAASYVIGREAYPVYNDIDVLISVDLTSNTSTIQKVKSAVLNALISFLPDEKLEASQQESSKRIQPMQRSLKFNTLTGSCCNLQLNSDDNTPNISSKDNQSISTAASSPSTSPVRMKSHMSSTELRNIDRMRMPNSNSSKKEFTDFSDSSPDNHQCDVHHHSSTVVSKSNHIDCSCSVQPSSLMINSPSSLQSGQQQQSVYTTSNNSPFITLNVNTIQSSASTPNAASSPSDGFSLRESYVYKQFRKFSQDDDCWSLLSLGMPSSDSKVIEFKFVDRMKRQFEFTVDSFQIILDPLLSFYECNPAKGINPHFYPTVVGESVAGSFSEALYHLENKLIATIEPEMIRGGGLLKYCRLLVSGYKPVEGVDVHTLEKYMSSRFFIDFQDITSQKVKLEAFLANHFSEHEISVKINYLRILYQVVSGSTICLMSHEHFQTLNLITEMLRYLMHYYHYCYSQFNRSSLSLEWFTEKQNLVLDKIYFGTQLFPVISRSEPYSSSHCYCRLANKPTPVIQSHSKIEQKSSCTFYNGKKNNLQTVSSASPSSTDTTKLKSDAVIQSDEQNNK